MQSIWLVLKSDPGILTKPRGQAMQLMIIKEKCIMCGACIVFCPEKAIEVKEKKAFIVNEKCTGCRKCVGTCYMRAIKIIQKQGVVI